MSRPRWDDDGRDDDAESTSGRRWNGDNRTVVRRTAETRGKTATAAQTSRRWCLMRNVKMMTTMTTSGRWRWRWERDVTTANVFKQLLSCKIEYVSSSPISSRRLFSTRQSAGLLLALGAWYSAREKVLVISWTRTFQYKIKYRSPSRPGRWHFNTRQSTGQLLPLVADSSVQDKV